MVLDELDSFMFQSVGHEAINLIAEAIGLPLFRQPTSGISKCQSLSYKPVTNDEVSCLLDLIQNEKSL